MIALIALLALMVALFAGWMLWGWAVSEAYDIAFLRKWCAIFFTITSISISSATGAGIAVLVCRNIHRAEIRQFASALEDHLRQGKPSQTLRELQAVTETPDVWSRESSDIHERMLAATARLQGHLPAESSPPLPEVRPQAVRKTADRATHQNQPF